MSDDDLFAKLSAPFPPDQVSWRVGTMTKDKTKAMALAYIDARDVMDRLDDVCGPAGWANRYTHADKKTICEIGLWVDGGMGGDWVWKADGAGESDIEAEKGALSDSFKRAAVRWGIGRYLYHLASPWVEVDEYKRIKKSEEPKLRALLSRDAKASEPPPPRASEVAINLLRACSSDQGLFKEAWEKNKEGWKKVMYEDEYRDVVAVMKEIAATFAPKAVAA